MFQMALTKAKPTAPSLTSSDASQNTPGGELCQSRPKPAKSARSIIPAPQVARIMQLHFLGKSIREIARKEMRDRSTVANIVHSEDMRELVVNLRGQLYALGRDALEAVKHALTVELDAHLAYRLLADIGAVPSLLEREPIRANAEVVKEEKLNAFEKELAGETEGSVRQIIIGVAQMMQKRAKFYGYENPSPEDLRHTKVVAAVLEELTDGRDSELTGVDRHRLCVQIENALRGVKEAEEKRKEDEAQKRAAKARSPLDGGPGSGHRPRLRLPPHDTSDGLTSQPGVASGPPAEDGSANPPGLRQGKSRLNLS